MAVKNPPHKTKKAKPHFGLALSATGWIERQPVPRMFEIRIIINLTLTRIKDPKIRKQLEQSEL
jgi:hypothetical protein